MEELKIDELETVNVGDALVSFVVGYLGSKAVDAYGKYVLGIGVNKNGRTQGRSRGYF
ncbi:hypothetical protein K0040_05950 [Terrisporobacter petrolearius]|uniref:hypothetical protein n=1 Tax=Terrisporobacter petrolearius TaxID=1460447 RepID=UPI001D16964D|nr:hypothetical protein [Terrisporobacter petrolearius]MCC3863854.1 hypothetical protein [Terrisporobacter petrolearius]